MAQVCYNAIMKPCPLPHILGLFIYFKLKYKCWEGKGKWLPAPGTRHWKLLPLCTTEHPQSKRFPLHTQKSSASLHFLKGTSWDLYTCLRHPGCGAGFSGVQMHHSVTEEEPKSSSPAWWPPQSKAPWGNSLGLFATNNTSSLPHFQGGSCWQPLLCPIFCY